MSLLQETVPTQHKGTKTGAIVHRVCKSLDAAEGLYRSSVRRLLDVNAWGRISGGAEDKFVVTDQHGRPIKTNAARAGNFIRINLPAPGNKAGQGHDWVGVEKIESEEDEGARHRTTVLRVRPSADPRKQNTEQAHFYTKHATSTFCVVQYQKTVWAMELGRNELVNTKVSLLNKIRNAIVALGARLGVAKMQWSTLMKAIIEK